MFPAFASSTPAYSARACSVVLSAALSVGMLFAPQVMAEPTIIAVTGELAPDGSTFATFQSTASINDEGRILFQASLVGGAASTGLFTGLPGDYQTLALQGSTAPGAGGAVFNGFVGTPVLNSSGSVAFYSSLSSGTGVFTGLPGSLSAVALSGAAAPTGGNYNTFMNTLALNDAGQIVFRATLTGGTSSAGIFTGTPGELQAVALTGWAAPGAGGATFSNLGNAPVINAVGQVAFQSTLAGGVTTSGIFTGTVGSLQAVALVGNTAPGMSGATFTTLSAPTLNSAGSVAFHANTSSGTSGIFTGVSGSLQGVAAQGNLAPRGGVYGTFSTAPLLNANGQVAFYSNLVGGGSTSGIFLGTPDAVSAVAVQGDATPIADTAFSNFTQASLTLNSFGQMAFIGTFTGTGVTTSNDQGLFGFADGKLSLLLREGDILDTDPGEDTLFKTVISFGLMSGSGADDGRASGLNDAGQLIYRINFADASTALAISVVPEPTTAVLCALPLAGLLGFARRRSRLPLDRVR